MVKASAGSAASSELAVSWTHGHKNDWKRSMLGGGELSLLELSGDMLIGHLVLSCFNKIGLLY